MRKSTIIVSCIILLLGIGYGFNTQVCSIMFPDIVDTLREVSAMSSETGRVVDENGKLLENCYEEFQKRCEELFIKDCFDYYNYMTAMKAAMDNYSETSDVVISNELISFRIQALWRTGDKIKARLKTKLLQKYVPYSQETQMYRAILSAGESSNIYTMEKDSDGKWKVSQSEIIECIFDSPQRMGWTSEDYEKDFPTRQEACNYLNTLEMSIVLR